MKRFCAVFLICCLLLLPCISMAESVDELAYPYEYDTRFEYNEATEKYEEVFGNRGWRRWPDSYVTKQEIMVPLLIHTQHEDGTKTTIEKTVKVGEIHYLVEIERILYGEDEVPGPLLGVSLYCEDKYPIFVQTPVSYGALSLDNRITFVSCPGLAGFIVDENDELKIFIKGGEYQLYYISEITYNEAHEVLSTVVTDENVTYDFEATEFEDAEHPDG